MMSKEERWKRHLILREVKDPIPFEVRIEAYNQLVCELLDKDFKELERGKSDDKRPI